MENLQTRTPTLASEYSLPGRGEKFVDKNGEINASSRKDMIQTIASFMQSGDRNNIIDDVTRARNKEEAAIKQKLVSASWTNEHARQELGELMAEDLYAVGNRDGFARRFLAKQELNPGEIPRVKMRMKNVTAIAATGPDKVETQITQDNFYSPTEFELIARPFVTKREIDTSVADVVDEKYVEGLEALMVTEDRIWKRMADATVGIENPLTNVAGSLTPAAVMATANHITSFNIPIRYLLLANDLWVDIATDSQWSNVIDPVSQYNLLQSGKLGTLYGMEVLSDGFRHPQHRVLNRGEFYAIGDAQNHGTMTDRGGIDSSTIDATTEKVIGKGWLLVETISMIIANARSVARGIR